MAREFDPYHEWLGIPPSEQPPNLYRLLGVSLFEENANAIENAADQRMILLRGFATGKQAKASQKLLNEVSQARIRLLNPERKEAYDAKLRQSISGAVDLGLHDPGDPSASKGGEHGKARDDVGRAGAGRSRALTTGLIVLVVAALGMLFWVISTRTPGGNDPNDATDVLATDQTDQSRLTVLWKENERLDATVWLDSEKIDPIVTADVHSADHLEFALTPGEYRLRIEWPRFEAFDETVTLTPRSTRELTVVRRPRRGWLIINWPEDERAESTIRLDGHILNPIAIMRSPSGLKLSLPAGEHRVRVEWPGCEPFEETVAIDATDARTVTVVRRAVGPPQGRLVLAWPGSDRREAIVRLDGQPMALPSAEHVVTETSVTLELPPGEHRIRIEWPGYVAFEETVTLVSDTTSEVTVLRWNQAQAKAAFKRTVGEQSRALRARFEESGLESGEVVERMLALAAEERDPVLHTALLFRTAEMQAEQNDIEQVDATLAQIYAPLLASSDLLALRTYCLAKVDFKRLDTPERRSLAQSLLVDAWTAYQADDYPLAGRLVALADSCIAGIIGKEYKEHDLKPVRDRIAAEKARLGRFESLHEKMQAGLDEQGQPRDGSARFDAGRYLVAVKGRWNDAVEHFTQCDTAGVAAAAKLEETEPFTPVEKLAVAKAWLVAEGLFPEVDAKRVHVLGRTAYWLRAATKAVPTEATAGNIRLTTEKLKRAGGDPGTAGEDGWVYLGVDGWGEVSELATVEPEMGVAADSPLAQFDMLRPRQWVDLLRLVNVDRDVVAGQWTAGANSLEFVSGPFARVMLPVFVSGAYELDVDFTRNLGEEHVSFVCPVGIQQTLLVLGTWHNTIAGIKRLQGKDIKENPTGNYSFRLENGRRYRLRIMVRPVEGGYEMTALLDGVRLTGYTGPQSDFGIATDWALPCMMRPALAAHDSSTVFHRVRFRLQEGEARTIPPEMDVLPSLGYEIGPRTGSNQGGVFRDMAPSGGRLVGFAVDATDIIHGLQPIYRNDNGLVPGGQYSAPKPTNTRQVIAKPGYSVGGIEMNTGDWVDGFKLTFMRDQADRLDPNDSYTSEWIGGQGGGGHAPSLSDGRLIIGAHGTCADQMHSLGFIFATSPQS